MIQTTHVTKTQTTVGTTSARIVEAQFSKFRRRGLVIFNNSSNILYISYEDPALTSAPVFIIDGFASFTPPGEEVWQGAIYAIRNLGTGLVTVWELGQP